jgi:hypothetical protein
MSHFDIVKAKKKKSSKHGLTPKFSLQYHLTPKKLVEVSFTTDKYMKSHELWQVII